MERLIPWFLWRRLVWVSKGSGKIQSRVTQYVPVWEVPRRRHIIELLPDFSHWYVYPDGTKPRALPPRPRDVRRLKKLNAEYQPTEDDFRWLQEVARKVQERKDRADG